jgi:foldase protein PrsA
MLVLAGCSGQNSDGTQGTSAATPESDPNVVATVNDDVVDAATFNIYFAMYERAYKQYYGDDILDQEFEGVKFGDVLREDILNMLVQDALIRQYVLSTGYTIEQTLFDEKYQELQDLLADDEETKAIYDEIGVDEAFLKTQVEGSILMDQFSTLINEDIDADTETLDDLYANYEVQVRARHILVDDEATALELKDRIEAGEDFAVLAAEYSTDTGSASAGGDLDYFDRGVMVQEFEDAAFSLPIGQISDPIKTDYGYHLIEVEDIKTVNSMIADGEDDAVVEQYKDQIKTNLFNDYYTKKLDELEAAATIATYIEKVTPADDDSNTSDTSDTTEAETTTGQ